MAAANQSRAVLRFAPVSPRKTRLVIDQVRGLSEANRHKIFEGNARRVYSRLDARLKQRQATRRAS